MHLCLSPLPPPPTHRFHNYKILICIRITRKPWTPLTTVRSAPVKVLFPHKAKADYCYLILAPRIFSRRGWARRFPANQKLSPSTPPPPSFPITQLIETKSREKIKTVPHCPWGLDASYPSKTSGIYFAISCPLRFWWTEKKKKRKKKEFGGGTVTKHDERSAPLSRRNYVCVYTTLWRTLAISEFL